MILFFVDIDVFFIYLFFFKRQRSLRSSLRFHRIRSAVICNIVTVTVSTRWEIFFFQNDLHTFFSIEEGTGGTWKCQRQNNFDNRDRNSITARRGWIFASERYSIQWPKRFNRSFGKRWKPVDRISRYTSLSIRVSVVVDQIMKCAFHK